MTVDAVARLSGRRRPYTGLAVLGLATVAAGVSVPLVAGGFAELWRFAPGVVAPLAAAALLWWRPGWLPAAVAGTVAAGMLAVNAPLLLHLLAHPYVFFQFVPAVMYAAGCLVALGAAGAALTGRADLRAGRAGERGLQAGVLAGLALLALLSGVWSLSARTTVSAADLRGAILVRAGDFAFAPRELEARAGEPARFVLRNDGLTLHTFTIDELGVDATVLPGSDVLVEVPAAPAGSYVVYCVPHAAGADGHLHGMVAVLHVR